MAYKDYYKARRNYTIHRIGGMVVFATVAFLLVYITGQL